LTAEFRKCLGGGEGVAGNKSGEAFI